MNRYEHLAWRYDAKAFNYRHMVATLDIVRDGYE